MKCFNKREEVGLEKYDQIKYLKKTKARVAHQCHMCNGTIEPGEYYYAETEKNKFLHSLHAKRFCSRCYEEYGDQLLSIKKQTKHEINN